MSAATHPVGIPQQVLPFVSHGRSMPGIKINDSLEIPEEQLEWSFSRSSGPGGQNVNKVNSKATLRWRRQPPTLTATAWSRFKQLASRYLTTTGEVVIQSQEQRDQTQNIEACERKLRNLVLASLKTPKRRIATKPSAGARRRRLDDKRKQSDKKQARQTRDFN
jgi:ribosome-associated protein